MQRLVKPGADKGRYDQATLDAVKEELSPDELSEFLKKFPELVCECGCGGMVAIILGTDGTDLASSVSWAYDRQLCDLIVRLKRGRATLPVPS